MVILILAQVTSSPVPPLALAFGGAALVLFLIVCYLFAAVMPSLKRQLRDQQAAQAELQNQLTSRDAELATQRQQAEQDLATQRQQAAQEIGGLSRQIDELSAAAKEKSDFERVSRELKEAMLAVHVERRCRRRQEATILELQSSRAGHDRRMAELLERQRQLERQVRDAQLHRHVQRRLQARLEQTLAASGNSPPPPTARISPAKTLDATHLEEARRHRARHAAIQRGSERTKRRIRSMVVTAHAHQAERRRDRQQIKALSAQVKQLQGAAKVRSHSNTAASLTVTQRKLKNLRRALARC